MRTLLPLLPCVVTAAFLGSTAPAQALPPGYFVDSTQAFAPRPTSMHYDDGDFTLSITRDFADSTEARLLGIAEATYPPRVLLEFLSDVKRTELGGDTAHVPLWWHEGEGVHRVPYAVTAGALDYYRKLTERMRSHNFWGAFARSLFWTDLRYEAKILHKSEYVVGSEDLTEVYVAEMVLAWGYNDGVFVPICRAHRIVVLAPTGEVLSVEGDGSLEETVSLSPQTALGFRKRLMR